jgi:hypothetical protein
LKNFPQTDAEKAADERRFFEKLRIEIELFSNSIRAKATGLNLLRLD